MATSDRSASLITVVPMAPDSGEYEVRQIITPVAANVTKTESQVMEILRVRWIFDMISGDTDSSKVVGFLNINTFRVNGPTASDTSMLTDIEDVSNFAFATLSTEFTTSGSRTYIPEVVVDLTDGSGNGVIIASRTLDVIVGRQVGVANDSSRCEVYYKIKKIKNSEFSTILAQQLAQI